MSTTLGTLTLELSAPTAQLQADLRRADEMIRASNAVWSKPPTWGIAASLGDEMRAARSILNSSLKGIESDLKGYDLKFDIAKELGLEMVVAEATLDRSLKEMQSRVKSRQLDFGDFDISGIEAKIARLNGLAIAPKVDDSDLTALNQHLTLKEQHLDRVVAKFSNTPIVPMVDDRQLTALNGLFDRSQGSSQIRVTLGSGDDLSGEITKSIEKGFKSARGSLANLATSPFKSIMRGALEGAGRDLFGGVSKSFSEAINNALGNTIGSTDLVGRKLGEKVFNKFQQIGYQLAAEYPVIGATTSIIQKEIRSSLGEREVAIEANKARGKQVKQQQKDLAIAREGITEERKAARENLQVAEQNAVKTYRDVKPLEEEIDRQLAPDRQKQIALNDIRLKSFNLSPIEKLRSDWQEIHLQSDLDSAVKKLRQRLTGQGLSDEVIESRISTEINRRQEVNSTIPSKTLSPKMQQRMLSLQERINHRREKFQPAQDLIDGRLAAAKAQVDIAQDRSDAANAQAKLLRRKQQPKIYQNILDEIAPNLPDHLVPGLVSNPNAQAEGEFGRYNVVENQIYLDPRIHAKLTSGKRLTKTEYKTVREELEHAKDLEFGQFAGYQSLSERRLLGQPVKATPAEEATVALELKGYADDVKPFERNAKIKTNRAYEQYANQSRLEDITNYVGEGGRKFSRQALNQFKSAESGLATAQEVAQLKSLKLPALSKLESEVKDLKLEHLRLVEEIQKAQAGTLSPQEVQKLESDLVAHTNQIISTRGRIKAAGKAVVKVANRQLALTLPLQLAEPSRELVESGRELLQSAGTELISQSIKPLSSQSQRTTSREHASDKFDLDTQKIGSKEAIKYAKNIQQATKIGKEKLKQALKAGDKASAEQIAQLLKQHIEIAASEIDELRESLKLEATIGTDVGDKLGQTQSVISRTRNDLNRFISVHKLNIENRESLSNLAPDPDLETLSRKKQPRNRKYNARRDPFGAGFEAIAFAEQAQNQFDRAEGLIQDREHKILKDHYQFQGIDTPYDPLKNLVANKIEEAKIKLGGLSKMGLKVLGVFGGYTLLSMGVPAIIAVGKSVTDLTSNFEQLQLKLQASNGSLELGRQRFAAVRAEAQKLGVSQSGALETAARIAATTYGTELEGLPSNNFSSQITRIAQARGLSQPQTNALSLAISQILGKPRVSAEELNQLVESGGMPDARTIAARAMGMTPQQFSKAQESEAGIDPKKFMSAFLSQATSDSLLIKDDALTTQQAKLGKLQGNIENLQLTIGKGIDPVFKAGIDLLSSSIALLKEGIEFGSKLLIGFATVSLVRSIPPLINLTTAFLNSGKAASFFGMSVNTMTGVAPKLGALVVQMLAFYAIAEGIGNIVKNWKNAGDEFAAGADKIQGAIDSIKSNVDVKLTLPDRPEDIGGGDWLDGWKLAAQRTVAPIFNLNPLGKERGAVAVDREVAKASERTEGLDKSLGKVDLLFPIAKKTIGSATKLNQLDLELNQINSQRSALFITNPNDAIGIRKIDEKYRAKYQERTKLTDGISPVQSAITEGLNQLNNQKSIYDKLATTKDINGRPMVSALEYGENMGRITQKTEQLKKVQEEVNKAIKSSLDNLAPWVMSLDKIVNKFEDINIQSGIMSDRLKIIRNLARDSGQVTKGQSEYQASQDNEAQLRSKIAQISTTIKELKSSLNIIDPQALDNFRKNYRITDKTSAADLTLLGNNITNPVDKQIANKLAIIKQQEANLSGLNAQISDVRSEVIQRLKDENKEIRQYYLGLQREINPGQSFYNSQIAAVTIGRNKFLEAITGFGASLGDGFFGAISDLLDTSRIKLEAEAAHAAEIRSIIQNADDQRTDLKSRQNNSFQPVGAIHELPLQAGGFVSPLVGSDLAGIIAYQPIEQGLNAQKFTSPRSGRRRHGKVDLDYRVGGGAGSGVVAATSGTATYQDWGADGGYAVFIDYKDANGRNVRINNGHLNPQSVRGVFGDKKSMPVVAGQSIGSVHKLQGRYAGVRDHLDFGVKVDGQWVDPQEYLKGASQSKPNSENLTPGAMAMIKQYEGFHQKAYRDTDGVPTIGYGTRILPFRNRPVKMGDTIEQPEANAALDIELQQAKNIIAKNIRVPLNSNQLSALTSFVFNGGESMLKGEMADTINRGDFAGAGKLFGKYNRAMVGGKLQPLAGLTKRREAEAAMFGDSRDVPRPIVPSAQPQIQSRELLQQAKVLIDRNERDKIQASDTRYAATVSSNELAEQLKREKVIEEARRAARAARDGARNQRQSVGNLYTPDTIQGTQLKEQSDLSNRIETTLDSLLDAQTERQRAVFKNEMVVSTLSRKPNLNPNEQLSLKEAQAILPQFKATLAQIDKLIPLFEVAAKESKETIDRKQARENAKTITELSGSELDLKIQAYQTKKDATTATLQREPFNRDAASQDRDLELRIGLAQATKEKNSQLLTLDEKLANGTFALKYGSNKHAAYQEQVDRVNSNFDRKLNNYLNAQEQREQKFKIDLRQENIQLGYKRQEQSIGSIDTQIQRQELSDRGSAPYSNDNLIYLKSKRSSQQEQLASQRKLDDYGKQWKLAQGNPALQAQIHELANLERQDTIARRKVISENTDYELRTQGLNLKRSQFDRTQESDRSKIDIEREKLTGLKATGGYTRDREYKLEARTIQSDTNQKVFGLTQQRDAIIGTDDASIKLRNDLDALIKSTQELGDIKLANLKNQFDPIIDALTATKSATREVFETFAKTGKFDWRSILRAPTQSILTKSLDLATSGLFNAIAPASKPNNQPQDTWGQITSFLGQALFPKHADGGVIGTGRNKADDQLILAQRGEGIITHRGMDILGERGLHLLNRGLAPLPKFATGGVVGSLNNISMNLDQNKIASAGNNTVNMNFEGQSMSEEATDKHLIENLRNVVTQELIRHKKARTGLVN